MSDKSPAKPTNTTVFKVLNQAEHESEFYLHRSPKVPTVRTLQELLIRWYFMGVKAGQAKGPKNSED